MQFLANVRKSYGELRAAIVGIVRDAWQSAPYTLCLLVALSFALGLTPYFTSGVLALLINRLTEMAALRVFDLSLVLLLVGLGASYLMRDALQGWFQYYLKIAWIDRRQSYELRLAEKIASLDVATHEDAAFQDEVQVLHEQGSSFTMANFLDSLLMNGQNVAGMVAASLVVLAVDWRLFVLIFVACLPQLYSELRYGRGLWSIYEAQSEDRRLYQEMRQHTTRPRSVRESQTFQTVSYFIERQRHMLAHFLSAQKAEERKKSWLIFMSQGVLAAALLIVLAILVNQVLEGSLQVGTFGFVLSSAMGLEGTISAFLVSLANERTSARAIAAYYDIMRRERRIKLPVRGKRLTLTRAPTIEFRNVSFAYPTNPEKEILKDLSLTIGSGERVALVGVNGAGKSTLIKLLCRFYDPTKGAVLINGIDMRELDLSDWYRNLALLSQDYENYHLKVWELVRLGRISEERQQPKIEEAVGRSQANLFVEAFPSQYDQQLGQEFAGGIDPSGGQWQKLALARALYRNAFITVLDEPTAHIDAGAESQIFESLLAKITSLQSLILISHRFSTVRKADRICVLKDGGVAELGSHLELVRQGGIYADLFQKQAEGYH